jgi:hypothetical protein
MSNGKRKFRPIVIVIFCLSFVVCADSMASDVKIIEAAKKEGGEIEAYVTLRTDTAQTVWRKSCRSTIKNTWMNSEITLESEKQTCLMEN